VAENFKVHIKADEVGPHMALKPTEGASDGHMAISIVCKVYVANERIEESSCDAINEHAVISHPYLIRNEGMMREVCV
jgi:hypothetical protein